jgi:hypothetical protein
MTRARISLFSTVLVLAAAIGAAPALVRAAGGEVSKADAAKFQTFMDKLADISLGDQDNCDKMAADVSAHIDANKDLVDKANAATKSGAKLPKEAQDRVMATVNRMMPALMKCGPNPKVQAAFDKLSVFREHGKK